MADYEGPKTDKEQQAAFLKRALKNLNAGYYNDPRMFPKALQDYLEGVQGNQPQILQQQRSNQQLYDEQLAPELRR